METKKNAKHSLENKRFLFFQLGLIISLGFIFLAFEWTSYYKKHIFIPVETGIVEDFVIPNTFFTEPKVEAPKINKQKITQSMQFVPVANNTVITPINNITPNPIVTNPNIIPIEPEKIDDSDVPVFQAEHFAHAKSCKNVEDEEQRKLCTFEAINNVLRKNLKYPADMKIAGIEGTVYLRFVVDKTGNINNVEVLKTPHAQLSNEAIRVLKLLPEFFPAKQNGRTVSQYYTLPVSFKIKG
jgi:protein TonB